MKKKIILVSSSLLSIVMSSFLISYNSDNQNNNFNPTYTAINKSNISIKNNLIELLLFNSQNALTLSQTKVSDLKYYFVTNIFEWMKYYKLYIE